MDTTATVLSATARHVTFSRLGGAIRVHDENTGNPIAQVDLIHGFAHYTGVRGSAHEGVTAVIGGGIEGLTAALAARFRNGRDDRR